MPNATTATTDPTKRAKICMTTATYTPHRIKRQDPIPFTQKEENCDLPAFTMIPCTFNNDNDNDNDNSAERLHSSGAPAHRGASIMPARIPDSLFLSSPNSSSSILRSVEDNHTISQHRHSFPLRLPTTSGRSRILVNNSRLLSAPGFFLLPQSELLLLLSSKEEKVLAIITSALDLLDEQEI
jgi:hypothetical protein